MPKAQMHSSTAGYQTSGNGFPDSRVLSSPASASATACSTVSACPAAQATAHSSSESCLPTAARAWS